jgi:hypothetical protein
MVGLGEQYVHLPSGLLGPTVGFYGGIVYGFGYYGHGYEGGRWNHGEFFYNRAVNNINVTNIRNVYDVRVTNVTVNRVSYNGGPGGVYASPTAAEEAAARERHVPPVAAQTQHVDAARNNPQLRAAANQGRPPIAATPKPGSFSGAVRASAAGAPYHPPANRVPAESNARGAAPHPTQAAGFVPRPPDNAPRPSTPVHARNVPAPASPPPRNTGNAQADKEYQQRQEQLNAQHQREHEQQYQQQEQEHQRMSQQQASAAQIQQMERQHQQQTMQMEQRHAQEQQQLARPAPSPHNEPAKPAPGRH